MLGLSDSSKSSLASLLDQMRMPDHGWEYLASRGLGERAVDMFLLGVVPTGASAEWSRFEGMLAIPYLVADGTPVAVKFRALDERKQKYDQPSGQVQHLFNVRACLSDGKQIVVTEGEVDAMTLQAECGIPAVGIPGVNNWKPHYRRLLDGFEDQVILTDNDVKDDGSNPGRDLGLKLRDELGGQSRIVTLPPGEDVNSYFQQHGADGLRAIIPPSN